MSRLTRFSVSLDGDLVRTFDRRIAEQEIPTRSKAIGDLIRQSLIARDWVEGREVAGAVILVYDHHLADVVRKINAVQHDFHDRILATQHFHLDHDNCLEIVAVRGSPADIEPLTRRLRALKGIKSVSLATATTGQHLP
ncbi:MAG: nickel-responsive transcriptional regulator NikR [Lentisphaerae bacterium]|nr:nickel-responsive transcriptional regulator NikR [Lentisphaerota bacterium]